MSEKPKQIFRFPDDFPPITTGVLLLDEGLIITGHFNGFVVKWNIDSGSHEILHDCGDTIETISKSPTNQILIGCHSGLIFHFSLSNPKESKIIQKSSNRTSSRVWKSVWPTDNNFLTTSTYGGLHLFSEHNSQWTATDLTGHYHSIFGIANKNGKYIVSGDYDGNIIIWEKNNEGYQHVDEINIHSTIEDLVWVSDELFAAIDNFGHVSIFEFDSQKKLWKFAFSIDVARSRGNCIHSMSDGKTIFAGSNTELIQFDTDSQQIQTTELEGVKKIFSKENDVFVLTKSGLFVFKRTAVDVQLELIKYQYAKISIIGHTGVGKSTLCSSIVGSTDTVKPTFGKKIWTWLIPDSTPEKRIIFHDHGGQTTVLSTFLPFLSDSNIVLVFFKQTDNTTFEEACEIINELETLLDEKSKIFLVQTYIDQELKDVDQQRIADLIDTGQIIDCFNISPTTGKGVDDFLKKLQEYVDWPNSKTLVQSEHVDGLMKTITDLSISDGTVVDFNSIKKHFEDETSLHISINHLNFLLSGFSNQGLIEYYPEIMKSIIFYHDEYNKLRSEFPILVDQHKGIISIKKLQDRFGPSTYLQVLDNLFLNYSISIKDNDLRIFPDKLKTEAIQINEPFSTLLSKPYYNYEYRSSTQKIKLNNLFKSLIELKLRCVDASKSDGLFTWDTNACLYYSISEEGNSVTGRSTHISYFIGGKNDKICERLKNEFSYVVSRIFGTELQKEKSVNESQ